MSFHLPLLCLLALLASMASAGIVIQASPIINWPEAHARNLILPSMKCERRCLPPDHLYEVALLHDRRGCTKNARWNPEWMDNLGEQRPGRRLTGSVVEAGYSHQAYCEQEATNECAPSYHYYAVFAKGCTLSANGTIESYNTYTPGELARVIDSVQASIGPERS